VSCGRVLALVDQHKIWARGISVLVSVVERLRPFPKAGERHFATAVSGYAGK